MSNLLKVYIPSNERGDYNHYKHWLPKSERTEYPNKADLFMFAGGADVHPFLYGELSNDKTIPHAERDLHEQWCFNYAKKNEIPMLGICRGSQFLTVMAGGSLFQHVDGHRGDHTTFLSNGRVITVTSTHHQMMNPYVLPDDEYKVVGVSTHMISQYIDGYNNVVKLPENFPEPEFVYYPKINALCIQGHPEQQIGHKNKQDDLNEQILLYNDFIDNKMERWADLKYEAEYEY